MANCCVRQRNRNKSTLAHNGNTEMKEALKYPHLPCTRKGLPFSLSTILKYHLTQVCNAVNKYITHLYTKFGMHLKHISHMHTYNTNNYCSVCDINISQIYEHTIFLFI